MLAATALRDVPGVRLSFGGFSNGGKLQLTLASDDPEQLNAAAAAVERDLRTVPGLEQRHLEREPAEARDRHSSAGGPRRRARRHHRYAQHRHAHRDVGRRREQSRQAESCKPADTDPRPAARRRARRPRAHSIALGARQVGTGAAGECRRSLDGRRARAHHALRPQPQRDRRCRSQRHAARRHGEEGAPAPVTAEPAGGRPSGRLRRSRVHDGAVRRLRPGDGRRHPVHLPAARAAVPRIPAADHDPRGAAALRRRRAVLPVHHRLRDVRAVADRHADADGHRDQELDPAGRVRRARRCTSTACRATTR